MSDEIASIPTDEIEETPRQKHVKKLNAEALSRKRSKKKPVKIETEIVLSACKEKLTQKQSLLFPLKYMS